MDLLERLESEGDSGEVHLKTELGSATIWFSEGRLIDAELGTMVAQAAIFRLLNLTEATFQIAYRRVTRAPAIGETTAELLQARSRRAAEWQRLLELVPSLDTVPAVNRAMLDVQRSRLTEPEFALLALIDRRRSVLELIDDSGLDAVGVLERIVSYFQSGLLVVAPAYPSSFPRQPG